MSAWGLDGVSVRYGRRLALDDVSLAVPAGAVTTVIGGDGAGKTTLLRALVGVVRVSAGAVRRPARRGMGYVAGASGLYADLSVAENIAFVADAYGLRDEEFRMRRERLLADVGLAGVEGRLAGRLSGGMRQKLAFALALLHEPELLILDEPTTGVDPVSRAELWRVMAGAAARGTAVVMSTTYLDEAERAASVLVLDGGRAVACGPPESIAWSGPGTGETAARAAADESRESAQRAAGGPLAAARAAVRRFGDTAAVDGVDLRVSAGEVVGLLGANGAGKTTLIRLLLGLLRPTSGTVELFGRTPDRAARLRLGYVPQGLGLWDDLTVGENLAFSARAFGRAEARLTADLEEYRDTLVRDLALGLRRRVAFAAALAHDPGLLVLDEPTSGVALDARTRLWGAIHGAADAGAGVLVTTHHLDEAGFCDRLVVMAAGRVVAEGTVPDIVGERRAVRVEPARWEAAYAALERAGLESALLGRTLRVPGGDAARVRATLDAAGVAADLSVVPATLEETFVALARSGGDPVPSDATRTASRDHHGDPPAPPMPERNRT